MSTVYVLTNLVTVGDGDYGEGGSHFETRNVGVTFDLATAEAHDRADVGNGYETFESK